MSGGKTAAVDGGAQVKQALRALEKMQARLDAVTRARTEPIAIVGIGCRFPGGVDGPEAYWSMLRDGVDAITEVPPDRWNIDELYDPHPDAAGKMYTRWAGFVDGVDQFDPAFFGISPREAVSMDPQQRLLLEVAWEALERAAYTPERLASSQTGVYVGACSSDYVRRQFADLTAIEAYAGTGSAHSILANRLSYLLDLQGPSMAIDTACSSSLVAVHLASQALRSGECELALAAGVNLILSPEPTIIFCRARMMASDGRCKTFDARADGYVRGEGCGVVVLKRLSSALADRDPIWGLIRGSAVNQDGRSNGLAAPNLLAQRRVIAQALADARVDARQIGYVETHGTGTALGDPIEVEALVDSYGRGEGDAAPCRIGSVKTNIGHLEAAAGIAGLIKAVLCLRHRHVPPHLHLRTLNPNIALDGTRLVIPTVLSPWPESTDAGLAAVSSFGFGGTNAHVVLEAAPAAPVASPEPPAGVPAAEGPAGVSRCRMLTISARTPAAAVALAARYRRHLQESSVSWADVCGTANAGRAHYVHRVAIIADSSAAACGLLDAFDAGDVPDLVRGNAGNGPLRAAFLLTGQGVLYPGAGRQLYASERAFREAFDRCAMLVDPLLDRPLRDVLFASDGAATLQRATYAQPALFALEWALAQLWMSWGVQPQCLLGHSLGELVAACLSGVFSLEDALRLVAARGRLTEGHAAPGAMAAIFTDAEAVRRLLEAGAPGASVVADNGSCETVVGGTAEGVSAAIAAAESRGLRTRALQAATAFHSFLMEPVLAPFARVAATIQYAPAQIPIISSRTGRSAGRTEMSTADYWVRQMREPVQFGSALRSLLETGVGALIEVGPHPTLLHLYKEAHPDGSALTLPSLRQGNDESRQMLQSLGRWYCGGGAVSWAGVDGEQTQRVVLPTYPFQRARYWLDAAEPARSAAPFRIEWRPEPPSRPATTPTTVRWLLIADEQGVATAFAGSLSKAGADVTTIAGGLAHDCGDLTRGEKPWIVVDLASLDLGSEPPASGPDLVATAAGRGGSVLRLAQRVVDGDAPARIWLVTRGAHVVDGERRRPALSQAPVWGLGRVLAQEHADHWGGLIDLDPDASAAAAAESLMTLLPGDGREDQWIVRDGRYYAARLARHSPLAAAAPLTIDPAGIYLITGGLGEIGLCVAEWLAGRGARHLALAGRHAPGSDAQARLDAIRSTTNVRVFECDVAEPRDVQRLFDAIDADPAPLCGVVHCAGVLEDGVILRQDEASLTRVLAPKAGGAWELHTRTAGRPLQFFVLCSSAAGVLGSLGQSNYAAANVVLDALARWRHADGAPALSVQWGPWSIGMGRSRRRVPGVDSLEPRLALAILEQLLGGAASDAAVLAIDWAEVQRHYPETAERPLLAEFGLRKRQSESASPGAVPTLQETRPPMFATIAAADALARPALIRTYLEGRINTALRRTGPIADNQNIFDLGMDSLMAIEVLNHCRHDLGMALYPREIYSLPGFGALVDYVAREFERAHGREAQPGGDAAHAAPHAPPVVPVAPVTVSVRRNRSAIFLLSSPRSGSTLLRVMLAGHPALFSPPELHLLPFDSMRGWAAALGAANLTQGLQRAFMELLHADAGAAESTVQALIEEDRPVQQVYAMLQELAGSRTLLDKSPTYGASREVLARAEALFEQPRYIHLVRHPHAVIESFVRNRMHKLLGIEAEDPAALAEQVWVTTNRNIRAFLQEIPPGRQHFLRYEDLVRDPAGTSGALCSFLGLSFEPALLEPYAGERMADGVHARSLPIGDPNFLSHTGIDPECAETWRSAGAPRPLGQAGCDLAFTFGYGMHPGGAAVHDAYAMQEVWLDRGDLRLCLCVWGPETGEPVLCLHGALEHGAAWELVARRLAAQGFRVIAPDFRGHGRSGHVGSGGSYHLVDFLADADAVARTLSQPVRLVGHSMGAVVAAMLASVRPAQVAALVLVEPPRALPTEHGVFVDRLAAQLDQLATPPRHPVFTDVEVAARRLTAMTPSLPMDFALRAAERLTEPCDGGVRWRWDVQLRSRAGLVLDGATMPPEAYAAVLARIVAPAVIVEGDGSDRSSEAARAGHPLPISGARRVVVPGGHHLHLDAAEELAAVISECSVAC